VRHCSLVDVKRCNTDLLNAPFSGAVTVPLDRMRDDATVLQYIEQLMPFYSSFCWRRDDASDIDNDESDADAARHRSKMAKTMK